MNQEKNKFAKEISRRGFLFDITKLGAMTGIGGISKEFNPILKDKERMSKNNRRLKTVQIRSIDSNFEREPLIRPFGFKGGYMNEKWQVAALLETELGFREIGLCSTSVLWSDADVFASHTESAGNSLMFSMLEHALQKLKGTTFKDPIELLENLLPETYEYGKKITQNENLRKTFVLNSLVALDNAAWLAYARENGFESFDQMIPETYRKYLFFRNKKIASTTLISYAIPLSVVRKVIEEGYFFLKIKVGQPGTQEEMLDKDKKRIEEIHKAIGNKRTEYTKNGKIQYYLDANGRYEKKETLNKLLDYAEKIRALDQIAIIEEPFPEKYEVEVGDIGIRIAADESAHTDKDAERRIQMGYKAIALKAIAKTLSMTLKIIKVANEKGIPCFCADATANPILVDWNKNIAARIAPLPELGLSLLEANGRQNYINWDKMMSYHPCAGDSWTIVKNGLFSLNDDFFQKSGGIFLKSEHYLNLFQRRKS